LKKNFFVLLLIGISLYSKGQVTKNFSQDTLAIIKKLTPKVTEKLIYCEPKKLYSLAQSLIRQDYLGIIGYNNQRLQIAVTNSKIVDNENEISISGFTKVNDYINSMKGLLKLQYIRCLPTDKTGHKLLSLHQRIESIGLACFYFKLFEKRKGAHDGILEGYAYFNVYLDSNQNVSLNEYEKIRPDYINIAFIGNWIDYNENLTYPFTFSVNRIYLTESNDLDEGIIKFAPNPKYYNKGWESYYRATYLEDEDEMVKENYWPMLFNK
jgi:hypothetical protein